MPAEYVGCLSGSKRSKVWNLCWELYGVQCYVFCVMKPYWVMDSSMGEVMCCYVFMNKFVCVFV
jgi:hypothetical protein